MFYHLYPLLREYHFGFNVLRYITFRSACAAITAFLLSVFLGPFIIRKLKHLRVGAKPVKGNCHDLDRLHQRKEGTPTMGGVLIIMAVIISTLLWGNIANRFIILVLVSVFWLGVVGFVDDWIKVRRNNAAGLRVKYKLIGQITLGLVIGIYLYCFRAEIAALWQYNGEIDATGYTQYLNKDYTPQLTVPFLKDFFIPLSLFYILFVMLVVVGSSNAVNLTDGLDGLAIGGVIMVILVYAVFAYVAGNWKLSRYLNILFVDGSGELTVFCASMLGAGLGFLWFNTYPAQVFMGDTGSLALGGSIGVVAVIIKQEILLVLVGGVFVLEAISVILQVLSYRWTGKRLFAVAPLHHHYEMRGWPEPRVIVRFWILAVIFALVGLSTLKLR